MNESLVKNAADEQQVAKAAEKEKIGRDLELDDLRKILATEPGRRLLWRFLEKAGVYQSIWRQSAEIHYLSGKHDFGLFILSEIVEADEEKYFMMMRESQARKNSTTRR